LKEQAMNKLLWVVMAALVGLVAGPGWGQELYKAVGGPDGVKRWDATWRDEGRGRDVPVRVYVPRVKADGKGGDEAGGAGGAPVPPGAVVKFPVVVFSHGMGGSRAGYSYIGEHLASHGYIVVVPTHAGSDTAAIRDAMIEQAKKDGGARRGLLQRRGRGAGQGVGQGVGLDLIAENTSDPENLRQRPRDVSFVIDQIAKDEELGPIADLDRVAVAGHSFGSYTSLAVAGMLVDLSGEKAGKGEPASFRDARVKAVVAMSPQGTGAMGIHAGAWEPITIPVMMLTGTKDYGQGERSAAWRREGFEGMKGAAAWLVTITDATHMTFSDNAGLALRPGASAAAGHEKHRALTLAVTTAFLDASLKGDAAAAEWMKGTLAGRHEGWVAERREPAEKE